MVKSSQALFAIHHSLFTLEDGLALLDVGAQTLARVLGLEELLLEFALQREAVLEGDFRARLDAALDAADGERGLVGRGELPRVGERLLAEGVRRLRLEDAADYPQLRA